MAMPQLTSQVWLHEGFAADQISFKRYNDGIGIGITLGPANNIEMVFASKYNDLSLAEQESAARKAADLFTQIADQLAARRPGTRVRVQVNDDLAVSMVLNDSQAGGRACVVCKNTTDPMTPVGTVPGRGEVFACTSHNFTFDMTAEPEVGSC